MSDLHCLGAKGRCNHVDLASTDCLDNLARNIVTPAQDLHLDGSVFLGSNGLATRTIVVHTRLTVFRRIDSVALAKLDLALLVQFVDLPSDESVIVGVCVGCRQRYRNGNPLVRNCLLQSIRAPRFCRSVLAIGGK